MRFQATIKGQSIGYSLVKLFPVGPDINGQWFNLGHAGEGFYLTEDSGRMIGAYFTHDLEGYPTWYTFDCQKSGEAYSGPVYLTADGEMGVPHDPLESVEVGTITFTLGGEPDPEPEPEPDPEIPPNPFDGKLTFRVKGFKAPQFFPGSFYFNGQDGKWYVLWSTAQILWTQMHEGRNTTLELEITALEPISFLHTSGASGYGNPSIDDLPNSMNAGDTAVIKFRVDKANRPSPAADANFQINTNLGTLVLYTAHIMGGQ